jgi:UDP-glucose 4-epimerase
MNKILITGSCGYIGSCLYKFLLKKKYTVYGIDKVKKNNIKNIFKANLNDTNKLNRIIKKVNPKIIIHLAAQSTLDQIKNKKKYILNNYIATKNLLKSMDKYGINKIIFSSTAAVYKNNNLNLKENSTLGPNNIYGSTKLKCEKIIRKNKEIKFIIFRFFNVCSSIPSLKVGENHKPETHLIPSTIQKILKKKGGARIIKIYGKNYKTNDGTCIRDYIHIEDLCGAYEKAIKLLIKNNLKNQTLNIGTGVGYTNLEIVNKIKSLIKFKKKINVIKFVKRRKGDVDRLVCSYNKARILLGWMPQKSNLKNIIRDELKWQKEIS